MSLITKAHAVLLTSQGLAVCNFEDCPIGATTSITFTKNVPRTMKSILNLRVENCDDENCSANRGSLKGGESRPLEPIGLMWSCLGRTVSPKRN